MQKRNKNSVEEAYRAGEKRIGQSAKRVVQSPPKYDTIISAATPDVNVPLITGNGSKIKQYPAGREKNPPKRPPKKPSIIGRLVRALRRMGR